MTPLPESCDVLVIGAGPAGSACAQWLARHGLGVVLADQQAFPRDKVCGDGLIPDAHHALQRLGVHAEVMAAAQGVKHVGCIGPRGGRIDVPGRVAVLQRRLLDDILKRAAERAGARFFAPWRFTALLSDDTGRHCGAWLQQGEHKQVVRARWVVLATGAVPKALMAAEACERHTPSAVALRGYVHNEAMRDRIKALEVVWHKRLRKGYGWIFPLPGGVFNIGVGLAQSHRAGASGRGEMADVNLREVFQTFTEVYAPARELLTGGSWSGELKGAPLRCSLEGAQLARPGLLVTGEAAGSTYAFTGEGIGKAMETGLLAAEALLHAGSGSGLGTSARAGLASAPAATTASDAAVIERYQADIAALKPRFALYERANRVNDHPWLADLLIWRARKSPRILRRMEAVLEETGNPGNLVSLRGIVKLFVPIT